MSNDMIAGDDPSYIYRRAVAIVGDMSGSMHLSAGIAMGRLVVTWAYRPAADFSAGLHDDG